MLTVLQGFFFLSTSSNGTSLKRSSFVSNLHYIYSYAFVLQLYELNLLLLFGCADLNESEKWWFDAIQWESIRQSVSYIWFVLALCSRTCYCVTWFVFIFVIVDFVVCFFWLCTSSTFWIFNSKCYWVTYMLIQPDHLVCVHIWKRGFIAILGIMLNWLICVSNGREHEH